MTIRLQHCSKRRSMVDFNKQPQCLGHSFGTNMQRIWKWIFLKTLAFGFKLGTSVLHVICSLFYWGRGNAVPPIKNDLLLRSATKLAADIREGKLKSEHLVQSYIQRIREVEGSINATTYQRFPDAIREARKADELVASGKMSRSDMVREKPLLGIPISVKLLIQVKGLPFTGASLDSVHLTSSEDADVIKYMRQAGAIVLVTTNTPEKGLNLETINKVHGRTNNPYNTSRSACGSSGGEAALIGAGASLIGLANDTAGSIRMPSLFCGVYGHKPSMDLVSSHGQFARIGNITTIGPMCRYAEDLTLAMKVLTQDKKNAIKDNKTNLKNLKIYYVLRMGYPFGATLDNEIKDAFLKVLQHFEITYGIKPKKVDMPLLKQSESIFLHNLISDVGTTNDLRTGLRVPPNLSPIKELIKFLLGISKYTIIVPFLLNCLKCPLWYRSRYVPHYKDLLHELKKEFDGLLDEQTVFLCPTLPKTALYHTETLYLASSLSYVGIWNYLGLPATHCPLGLNKKGLPLGLQVVGSKNNDTLNFAVACELEKAFGGWVPPGQKQ